MSDTPKAVDVTSATTREELLVQHADARHRRNARRGRQPRVGAASRDVGRIEVEIARLERAMDPPRVWRG